MSKFIFRGLLVAIIVAFAAVTALPVLSIDGIALAQDVADTPEPEPTLAPTATNVPETPAEPTQIPEPITVILFGSGLAALSASVAKKRKKQ